MAKTLDSGLLLDKRYKSRPSMGCLYKAATIKGKQPTAYVACDITQAGAARRRKAAQAHPGNFR